MSAPGTTNDAIARQAGLLAGVLVFLLRDGSAAAPSALGLAGTVALLTYGALALGPALWRRLAAMPSPAAPPAPASSDA